jgi:hypothetical protein
MLKIGAAATFAVLALVPVTAYAEGERGAAYGLAISRVRPFVKHCFERYEFGDRDTANWFRGLTSKEIAQSALYYSGANAVALEAYAEKDLNSAKGSHKA